MSYTLFLFLAVHNNIAIFALLWLSRKSVGIQLEVEGKTSFVLWQKNISKQ